MKISNKQEFQQIASNHPSDIDFRDFTKPYSFSVIDTTLASDNLLRFRKNLLERIQKLIMATDDKIREIKDVKLAI